MTTGRLPSAIPLSRATSRTRTGRTPLTTLNVAHVEGTPDLGSIYAGPVARDPHSPFVPGTMRYPAMGGALQAYAVSAGSDESYMALAVDLGRQYDVSRVELYGNLLLPPVVRAGRPVHNFGLPRGVGIAVLEDFHPAYDLHGRVTHNLWPSQKGVPWHQRFLTYDLRALWGWTPISLPPTFGRYLMFLFFDLPLIYPDGYTTPRPGLDIQRMVVYPFLQDADHRPLIEASPVASWQGAYDQPSRYWTFSGEQNPQAQTHQSLFRSEDGAVLTPGVLDGIVHLRYGQKPASLYSSDRVKTGTDNRVHLVMQATTDETPLLDGVGLSFVQPSFLQLQGNLHDYRIEAWATNDPEAAWSPAADHPSWRLAMGPKVVRASLAAAHLTYPLMFPYPQYARYLRLTVGVLETQGLPNNDARFILAGVSLLRPHDYVLTPEEGQDMRVDYVVMRMRGAEIFGDHAFIDGTNGAGLTLELQEGGGPFKTLHSFRSLLDILENTQNRAYSNQRYNDKPVQITDEVVDTTSSGHQSTTAETTNDATSRVDFDYQNYTVTKTGAITEHKDKFAATDNFDWLEEDDLGFVRTERRYGDPEDSYNPSLSDIFGSDIPSTYQDFWGRIDQAVANFDNIGRPLSLSVGGSGSLNFSLGAGGSVGISVSASGQVGGGITRAKNIGKQGSATLSESKTLEAKNRQYVTGTQTAEVDQIKNTSHDVRHIVRTDVSVPVRQKGVGVQYGGKAEDILLIAIPVNTLLRGHDTPSADVLASGAGVAAAGALGGLSQGPKQPKAPRDVMRLRIDHLPPGVTLDVEFRGSVLPKEGGD